MEVSEFFLKFFLILVAAKAMGELFAHMRLPAVIGEIVAGVIIGPSLLGVIGAEPEFLLLSKIGMLLLLFEVGVDTDVGKLMAVGGQSTLVAMTGVVLPIVGGYYVASYFGLSTAGALFVGGTMVATSIGITVRVLKDLGRMHTEPAQVVLGAAVLDDVVGVVILAVVYEYTMDGQVDIMASARVLGLIALFLFAAPLLSRILVMFMARVSMYSKTQGILSTIVVALILILSVMAHELGAPEIIGAFAAGLALTRKSVFTMGRYVEHLRTEIITRAEEKMTPIGELFIPFFFVMVGVSLDLTVIDFSSSWFFVFGAVLTAVAFVTKLASGVWVRGPVLNKLSVGTAMVPRGEVGIIFAETGLRNGVFDAPVYAVVVLVVAVTTILGPVLLRGIVAADDD